MKTNFTAKKILITLIVVFALAFLVSIFFLILNKDKIDYDNSYSLQNEEVLFNSYTKISDGKYFLLERSNESAIIDKNMNKIEDFTKDDISMIKYFNSNNYSDLYYTLGDNIKIKKNGELLVEFEYDLFDFDLRKNKSTVEMLNENNILFSYDTTLVVEEDGKRVTKNISYGYVYNIENKILYIKLSSYDGFDKIYGVNDEIFLLLKDENSRYNVYSVNNNKILFNTTYAKIGRINNNKINSKSNKYLYVCSDLVEGIYNKCGIIDTDNNVKVAINYNDTTVLDYNDDYYILKTDTKAVLYDYNNKVILNDLNNILLSNNYIITFKDEIMNIYDYELKLLKTIDTGLKEIITFTTENNHKNIELIDGNETIIINTYDNINLNNGGKEGINNIVAYIYGNNISATIKSTRIYPVYNDLNNLTMFYGLLYNGKSIEKVYLYNNKLEAYRVMELDMNNGNFEIINTCDDLSVGYILDKNYYIYYIGNENNKAVLYTSEKDYLSKICNTIPNNKIYLYKNNEINNYNSLKEFYELGKNKYLIIYDNKIGIYSNLVKEDK